MKNKVLLEDKEIKREKINRDIFKEKESIIEVNTISKEEKIIKKQSEKFFIGVFVALIVLLLFFIVVCLIDVFSFVRDFFSDQLMGNIVAGSVVFLLALIISIFVIRPIIIALSSPMFTIDVINATPNQEISRRNFKKMQKVAKNIIDTNDNVSKDSKNLLKTFMHNKVELNATLKKLYKTEINKDINKTITATATKVLLTTAISQSGKFDALSVALTNIRMIMQICVKCGYHPTYAKLTKLIIKVFRNSLIAYSIESLNVGEAVSNGINKLTENLLGSIPIIGTLTKSIVEGSTNALLTLRIGYITRKYLYEEYSKQEAIKDSSDVQQEIVDSAIKEANDNIDDVVKECKNIILIGKKNSVKVK